MHCQKPLCLYAINCFFFDKLISGSCSNTGFLPFINLKISLEKIKKPALIHVFAFLLFSSKF